MGHALRTDDNVIDLSQRLPTRDEINNAGETIEFLKGVREDDGSIPIGERGGRRVVLAAPIAKMLLNLLGYIAKGEMITLVPKGAMLTTQDAADMLNVSRPYLVKLLKSGEIAFERVGTHRRVPFEVLMAYKEKRDLLRKEALDELAWLGQDFDTL
jgi:excisionase family DNA binding protein